MSKKNWWKIEDEILERYSKNHSFRIQKKNYPDQLLVRHSRNAFRAEVILGILMIILPFLFLIPHPEIETFIGITIASLFGVVVILGAKRKLESNNYDLTKEGIRYKQKMIDWDNISEIQKVRLKERHRRETLRVLDKNGISLFDLPFTSDLNPKPYVIKTYLLFLLNNCDN